MRGVAYFAAKVTPNETGPGSTISFELPSAQEIKGSFLLAERMNISQCSFAHITDLGADLNYLEELGFLEVSYEPLSLAEMEEREHRQMARMMQMRDRSKRFEQEEEDYNDTRWLDSKGSLPHAMRLARIISFEKLHLSQPDYWSLCSTGEVLIQDDSDYSQWHAAGISLMNAIPVPDKDVPLEEIRLFKERRREQLLYLWHSLDEARFRILESSLPLAAHQKELENLELALIDMRKVAKEWKVAKRLVDIHSRINLPFAGAIGIAAAQGIVNHRLILGGAAVDLCLSIAKGMKRLPQQPKPFEYVARYHSEIFNRYSF